MAVSELRRSKPGKTWVAQRWTQHVLLAKEITAPTDGEWVDVEGLHPFTVVLSGDFVGEAELLAANDPEGEQPGDTDNDYPVLATPFLKKGSIFQDGPYRWLKLRVMTVTSGTIRRVWFFAAERPGT